MAKAFFGHHLMCYGNIIFTFNRVFASDLIITLSFP